MQLRNLLIALAIFVATLLLVYQLQVAEVEVIVEYYEPAVAPDLNLNYGQDPGKSDTVYSEPVGEVLESNSMEYGMPEGWDEAASKESVTEESESLWERAEAWRAGSSEERFGYSYTIGMPLERDDDEDEEYALARKAEAEELLLETLAERMEVHLPEKLERCIVAEVIVTLHCDTWVEKALLAEATKGDRSASELLRVQLECSAEDKQEGMHHTSPQTHYTRFLPVRHRQRDEAPFVHRFGGDVREVPFVLADDLLQLSATFFPDDSTDHCRLRVTSNVEGALPGGVLEREYDVEEKPIVQGNCWWCYGKLHHDFALSLDYHMVSSRGKHVSPNDELHFSTAKPFVLWIKPTEAARAMYGDSVKSTQFNAWLTGAQVRQHLRVGKYDERRGGYKVIVDPKDALPSYLVVTQQAQWPYSELLTEDPEPVLLSSHMSHEISDCDLGRSEIYGSRVEIRPAHGRSSDPAVVAPRVPRKCTQFGGPGRWLRLEEHEPCVPPYCTGDREAAEVNTMSWQGATYPFVWVPFSCHLHYYSMDDLDYCAEQQGIKWIHTMGDSLSREFVGYMISIYGMPDTQKFEHSDSVLNKTRIRMTFQSWQDMLVLGPAVEGDDNRRSEYFLKLTLDHFNLLEANTSAPLVDLALNLVDELNTTELTAPDVFVMNPAAAYAIFQQTAEAYDQYMADFMGLVGDKWDRWERGGHRVSSYWYGQPYVHGTAHPGTEYLTQGRSEIFRKITRKHLDGHAFPYIDPTPLTSCRWEESFDGLHYLLGTTHWNGHVTATVMQLFLNEMLGECSGRPSE